MPRVVRRPLLAALLALAACNDATRYAGTLATEQGACGVGFDTAGKAAATLLLQGKDAQFVPSDGVTVLTGHISDTGHVVAASTTAGADHKPFQQVFEGDRAAGGGQVMGHFATPRCRAAGVLTRR